MKKAKPRFTNRIYRAELSRTSVGSPILKIVPLNPKGPSASHRQIASFLSDLASEMEKRSEELGTKWVISPEAQNAQVVLELAGDRDNEVELSDEFLRALLSDRNLG